MHMRDQLTGTEHQLGTRSAKETAVSSAARTRGFVNFHLLTTEAAACASYPEKSRFDGDANWQC